MKTAVLLICGLLLTTAAAQTAGRVCRGGSVLANFFPPRCRFLTPPSVMEAQVGGSRASPPKEKL